MSYQYDEFFTISKSFRIRALLVFYRATLFCVGACVAICVNLSKFAPNPDQPPVAIILILCILLFFSLFAYLAFQFFQSIKINIVLSADEIVFRNGASMTACYRYGDCNFTGVPRSQLPIFLKWLFGKPGYLLLVQTEDGISKKELLPLSHEDFSLLLRSLGIRKAQSTAREKKHQHRTESSPRDLLFKASLSSRILSAPLIFLSLAIVIFIVSGVSFDTRSIKVVLATAFVLLVPIEGYLLLWFYRNNAIVRDDVIIFRRGAKEIARYPYENHSFTVAVSHLAAAAGIVGSIVGKGICVTGSGGAQTQHFLPLSQVHFAILLSILEERIAQDETDVSAFP